jgi:hypothetical protein
MVSSLLILLAVLLLALPLLYMVLLKIAPRPVLQ